MMQSLVTRIKRYMALALYGLAKLAEEKKTTRQQVIERLQVLSLLDVKQYQPNIATTIAVTVIYKDIVTYTKKLKELNYTISQLKGVIRGEQCKFQPNTQNLDLFFQTEDKYYISREKITEFISAAKELCDRTKGGDTATVGEEEHNYRMLTHVFVSLKSVSSGLIVVLTA